MRYWPNFLLQENCGYEGAELLLLVYGPPDQAGLAAAVPHQHHLAPHVSLWLSQSLSTAGVVSHINIAGRKF